MERKESRDWKLITVDSAIGPFLIIGFGFTFCLDFYIRLDGIFSSESKWWTNTFSQSYFIWRHKYGKQVSSLFFQCIYSHRIVLLFFEMENYSQLQCKAFNRSENWTRHLIPNTEIIWLMIHLYSENWKQRMFLQLSIIFHQLWYMVRSLRRIGTKCIHSSTSHK